MRRELAILATAVSVSCAQPADRPARLAYGEITCDYCQMGVTSERHAAQVTRPRGSPRAFDEAGCLLRFAARTGLAEDERAWVHTDGDGWLAATDAWFAVPESPADGMMYGVTAHRDSAGAAAALRGPGQVARYEALVQAFRQ
jgi:hypothetical protein